MMETISRGKGRVDIARPNLTKNVTGDIVEIDNATSLPVSALNNFTKYVSVLRTDSFFDLVYPGEEQKMCIRDRANTLLQSRLMAI